MDNNTTMLAIDQDVTSLAEQVNQEREKRIERHKQLADHIDDRCDSAKEEVDGKIEHFRKELANEKDIRVNLRKDLNKVKDTVQEHAS